jgi:hypothetical protein
MFNIFLVLHMGVEVPPKTVAGRVMVFMLMVPMEGRCSLVRHHQIVQRQHLRGAPKTLPASIASTWHSCTRQLEGHKAFCSCCNRKQRSGACRTVAKGARSCFQRPLLCRQTPTQLPN